MAVDRQAVFAYRYLLARVARLKNSRKNTIVSMNSKTPMDQFSAHLDRGWDLVRRGELHGAQVSAEKSVEIDPQSAEAHNLLGYVHAIGGNAEEALEHYRQAIALDETYVEAILNAAEVLIHPLHDFDAALNMADEALDMSLDNDESADALLVKFEAYSARGDREAAARIVALLPDGPFESARLDFLVGRARFEIGDIARAEALITRAVEREPESSDSFYYLGMIHESKGERIEATRAFLKARELDLRLPAPNWSVPRESFEQRVIEVIKGLDGPLHTTLQGALLVISDLPGVEVVADGMDPRAEVLLDESNQEGETPSIRCVFLYQRNIERAAGSVLYLDDEIKRCLEQELTTTYPDLTKLAQIGTEN
jgi:tetratricopeptide (TPR) repeat protein